MEVFVGVPEITGFPGADGAAVINSDSEKKIRKWIP